MAAIDVLLGIGIIIAFILLVVSKFTGKSVSDIVESINNMFSGGKEDE